MKATWDIFCTVVDNYGDIGITWRLARQLQVEHGMQVRLWVDDLVPFARLWPAANAEQAQQWHDGVEVRHWSGEWQATEVADVVVGAFACKLPPEYVDAMAARSPSPLWLNLDYLSAETWVDGCHGLPSPQPGGLRKYFFFPGFTTGTGGLLREAGLIERREAFQADPAARQAFLAGMGVEPEPGARLLSLFAYEHSGLASWLDALADDTRSNHLLVPEGRVLADVRQWLGEASLEVGSQVQRGSLKVQVLPFVRQSEYDRLLWCCDFNAVRGEDSFVRAQWAAAPMVWHIYVQEEYAHWEKLEAFLDRYGEGLSPAAYAALRGLWRAWNQSVEGADIGPAWREALEHWPELVAHARQWCALQVEQADLATALVQFYRNWL